MDVDQLDDVPVTMEVDENALAEAPAHNPLTGTYTWALPNFSTLSGKVLSDPFEIGGYSWQLLVYPGGNGRTEALSLYLAVAEDDQAAFGLQRSAQFKLTLLSTAEAGDMIKETGHIFTSRETDWGVWGGLLWWGCIPHFV